MYSRLMPFFDKLDKIVVSDDGLKTWIFHKIANLAMVLSDRRAKFQVSAPVSALARRFLRFLLVKIFLDNFINKIPKL